MTAYTAPTRDMQFVINELAGLPAVAALPAFAEQDVNPGLVEAVLEEAAKLAAEVLAPLLPVGAVALQVQHAQRGRVKGDAGPVAADDLAGDLLRRGGADPHPAQVDDLLRPLDAALVHGAPLAQQV